MLSFYFICVIINYVCSQPSNGLRGGPVEAECLQIMSRQRIWVPVALDEVVNPTTGPSDNPINLARHHIIPVRMLREFFNTAVTENHEGNVELSGLMSLMGFLSDDALNQYENSGALNRYIRDDLEDIRLLQTYYIEEEFDMINPPVDILFSARYLVRSMFQWIPANIFIGPLPNLRSDDPGDSFEVNSRYIVGEDPYRLLVSINSMMGHYVQTRDRATYNEIIELLAKISRDRDTPYPFDLSQWIFENNKYRINRDPKNLKKQAGDVTLVYSDPYCLKPLEKDSLYPFISSRFICENNKYTINRDFNTGEERTSDVTLVHSDPYCLKPLELIKMSIHDENLFIASEVLDRAIKNKGFYHKNYASWKAWYADSTWRLGIYSDGVSMAGQGWFYEPFGYMFEDDSFAVGILGTDTKGKNDNWVNLAHDFRETEDKLKYAGQVFFDKNGRPVAIVITSVDWANLGTGWSFIYNDAKWEYENTDSWDERRFKGKTESLDPTAPKFVKL